LKTDVFDKIHDFCGINILKKFFISELHVTSFGGKTSTDPGRYSSAVCLHLFRWMAVVTGRRDDRDRRTIDL